MVIRKSSDGVRSTPRIFPSGRTKSRWKMHRALTVSLRDERSRLALGLTKERMTEALRLQNAARNSMEWFEHVKRYVHLPPEQFAYSLLTRSQRVSHENLRLRDLTYVEGIERWFASSASNIDGGTGQETSKTGKNYGDLGDRAALDRDASTSYGSK